MCGSEREEREGREDQRKAEMEKDYRASKRLASVLKKQIRNCKSDDDAKERNSFILSKSISNRKQRVRELKIK
jgi:hypothetical protein